MCQQVRIIAIKKKQKNKPSSCDLCDERNGTELQRIVDAVRYSLLWRNIAVRKETKEVSPSSSSTNRRQLINNTWEQWVFSKLSWRCWNGSALTERCAPAYGAVQDDCNSRNQYSSAPPPNPSPPPNVRWGGIFLNTRNRNIAEFAQGGRSFLCCLTQPRPKMKVPFYSVTSNQCINKMTALPATNFVLELLRSFQCFICLCFAKRGFLSSICTCWICFLIRRTEGRSLVACLGIIC